MIRFKKPDKCCSPGEYTCQIPMPLNGRRQDIDLCVAEYVAALNAANIPTIASCCGHGITEGSICLEDGNVFFIKPFNEKDFVKDEYKVE